MNARGISVAAATLAALALIGIEIASWPRSARFGPVTETFGRCAAQVVSLSPAEAAAGLRDGDVINFRPMTVPARTAIVYHYTPTQTGRAGETIALAVQRGNSSLTVPYTLVHQDTTLSLIAQLAFKFFILAIGVFVLWRGRALASPSLPGDATTPAPLSARDRS